MLIDLIPSEETLTLIYDQDLDLTLHWSVIDLNITKNLTNYSRSLATSQAQSNVNQTIDLNGMVELAELKIQIDF